MASYFRYGAIAFILVSSALWTAHVVHSMRTAPDHAKRACAGKTSIFDGSDGYYWCLDRVKSGRSP